MLEQIRSAQANQIPSAPISVPSALTSFALRGLDSCWMPQHGRWSHIYHLDERPQPNESLPHSDVFYTLNVLLGFSHIRHLSGVHSYDLERIFEENVAQVPRLASRTYAYGMALWASAELGFEIPAVTFQEILAKVKDRTGWMALSAQDLGMVLIGCVEQAKRNRPELGDVARDLFEHLDAHYSCSSDLFYDSAAGWRRQFSSFATQTYLTLACYIFGEWARKQRALKLAKRCSAKLISLQGPQGEWPWFFFTPAGRVVDFYEVYSVHQDGMAPAWLEYAEKHGVSGARNALVKGFMWIYGDNQKNQSMLWKNEGLICRSHVRKGELKSKRKRVFRAISKAVTGGGQALIPPSKIDLRLECRSYHLGWVLWSFGHRDDLPSLVDHPSLI